MTEVTETKSKYPVAIFELVQRGSGSGFIREDTLGTANQEEIKFPKKRAIIGRSVVRKEIEGSDGKKVSIQVGTRYIYGHPQIIESEQKQLGIVPNPKSDMIYFQNGLITVPKDGAHVGMYEFLKNHAQNETSENRKHFEHLEPIFREIKPAENAQEANFSDFEVSEAVMYIKGLVTTSGKGYTMAEDRIDALCQLFGVFAESYEEKIQSLIYFAKTSPTTFLSEAKKSEQIVLIEVNHAIKIDLIKFEGNTAMYVAKNEKIKSFTGNLSDEKKLNSLCAYFQSIDGKEAYQVFRVELEAAKAALAENQ